MAGDTPIDRIYATKTYFQGTELFPVTAYAWENLGFFGWFKHGAPLDKMNN